MNILCLRSVQELEVHEQEIDALVSKTGGKNLFLSYAYIISWLRAFAGDAEVLVILMWHGSDLVGFFPLVRRANRFPWAKFTERHKFAGNGLWGYAEPMVDPDLRESVLSAFLDFVKVNAVCGLLEVGPLAGDSANLEYLREALGRCGMFFEETVSEDAPYIPIQLDFPSYLKTLTRKSTFNDVQRCRRRLGETGALRLYRLDASSSAAELKDHMDTFFSIYVRQWKENRFKRDSRFYGFYRELAERARQRGFLELSVLTLDEKVLAMHYGFVFGGCRYYCTPTYDPEFQRFSPGKVLLCWLIEESFRQGIEFDFLNGKEPYKLEWTAFVRSRVVFRVYSSIWARWGVQSRGMAGRLIERIRTGIL